MKALLESSDGASLAEALIREAELVVGGHALRIEEVELYYSGPGRRDPFAHCHPVQASRGRWYFHRAGASYRGGSFKGLDLTFGPAEAFGGVLIRSLRGDELTCGPSKCVDLLLDLAGRGTVAELDEGRHAFDPGATLHLRGSVRRVEILRTARVGLTLRHHAPGDERPRYLLRRDRWLTDPRHIRKGRVHTVMALHEDGRSPLEIRHATGSTAIARYLDRYARGRREPSFERFIGRGLDAGDTAELHGVWRERFG